MNEVINVAEQATQASQWKFGAVNLYSDILIVALIIVMITILITAVVVNNAMKSILRITMPEVVKADEENQRLAKIANKSRLSKRWNSLLGLRPIEEEKDITIDHEYDGIQELDNPVPIWFNALFYGTISFGLIYIFVYHVFGIGMNQDQEYVHEVAQAEIAKQEYLAQSANLVDETNVEVNPSLAAAGKGIFAANCAACHGNNGEGGIGPNLVDRFWLHGGEIKDVFKTVKYGIPEKGMVPWEQTLTPGQIAEVSNYILTLRDTKPANAKEAQGIEIITYETEATSTTDAESKAE
jgi:cytochrome c oxidase cbb3-type subunit III